MSNYTPNEMMTIAAARALKNQDVCFVGIGMPSAAANLARLTHAPDITLIYESGTLATKPNVLPLSIGDPELCETALTTVSVPEMFRYWLQGGRITVGFLGGAQIDKYANLNTTVVGAYDKPKVRLPGGGGAPEIATSCGEIFIIMAQGKRSFVDKLDFVTSLGHGDGGNRGKLGATNKGPTRLMTDLAIFEPEPGTNEMVVTSIHPGVSREQIADNTGWPVRYAANVKETPAPTDKELGNIARPACADQTRPRRAELGDHHGRSLHLRRNAHANRPLCRRARQGAHRRSRRGADQGADEAASQGRLDRARRGGLRLRQSGWRGQQERRAHGVAAGRPAGFDPGDHGEPAVRVGAQRRGRGGASHPRRRDRHGDRRRRRVR